MLAEGPSPMLIGVIAFLFLLLYLACGTAIVVRFRGSPGAVLGGIAFGVWAATILTQQVLGVLGVAWWQYDLAFRLLNLAATGCLLAALLTTRVHNADTVGSVEPAATSGGGRGPMSIPQVLFSFNGRISRSEYWLKGFLILLPFGILNNILAYGVDSDGARAVAIILGVISLWPGLALLVKRWRDRDRSAWWLATLLIPFLGILFSIWILIEAWFLKGTDGDNRFGKDPLRHAGAA